MHALCGGQRHRDGRGSKPYRRKHLTNCSAAVACQLPGVDGETEVCVKEGRKGEMFCFGSRSPWQGKEWHAASCGAAYRVMIGNDKCDKKDLQQVMLSVQLRFRASVTILWL